MDIERHHFLTLSSTQDWGKKHLYMLPEDKISLITSEEQTSGRGRNYKQWKSPAGQNIYATFAICLGKEAKGFSSLTLVLALVIASVLKESGFRCSLKWPNDVLINSRKIAGIIAETTTFSENIWMFLGYGLNVNMPESDLKKIDKPATSLLQESSIVQEIEPLIESIAIDFSEALDIFFENGFQDFQKQFEEISFLSGQTFVLDDGKNKWIGEYNHVDPEGGIVMNLQDGTTSTFYNGSISTIGQELR